jgi:alkanesulfonate monooxygenase SsuD/methylene tetrahydromethanopterin reductase-like flavin-dependent oxidoreductase (luciferase family)
MTSIGEADYAKRLARLAELQDQVRRIADEARKKMNGVLGTLDREAVEARRVYGTLPPDVRDVVDAPETVASLVARRADVLICAASLWPEERAGSPSLALLAEESL